MNYLRPDYLNQEIDAVTVETNGISSINTSGKFAALNFILKDTLAFSYPKTGEKIYARLLSATAIDSTGKEISIYGIDDSAIVVKPRPQKTTNGIQNQNLILKNIKIYPNPANDRLIIETNGENLR